MTGEASEMRLVIGGLRVRLIELPQARSVGACLLVGAGSLDDPPWPWGTAHLAEHISTHVWRERAGTKIVARTGNAVTSFSVAGPPERVGDIAAGLVATNGAEPVSEAVFESERHAVQLENRAAESNPVLKVGPAVAEAALPGHGLAATARATSATLAAITPADVQEFRRVHYRPASCSLAIVGPDLPIDHLTHLLAAWAGQTPGDPASDRPAPGDPASGLDPSAGPIWLGEEAAGLVALSVPADAGDDRRLARAAITADLGPLVAAARSLGLPLLGRAGIPARSAAVDVLCWRPGPHREPELLNLLRREIRSIESHGIDPRLARDIETISAQERHFSRHTPLGLAQAAAREAMAERASAGAEIESTDAGVRVIARRVRLWRMRDGRFPSIADE